MKRTSEKIRENENLETKARLLNYNVALREQILELDSGGGGKDDNTQNPPQKFETVATKEEISSHDEGTSRR